jgi:hypothetical protein
MIARTRRRELECGCWALRLPELFELSQQPAPIVLAKLNNGAAPARAQP